MCLILLASNLARLNDLGFVRVELASDWGVIPSNRINPFFSWRTRMTHNLHTPNRHVHHRRAIAPHHITHVSTRLPTPTLPLRKKRRCYSVALVKKKNHYRFLGQLWQRRSLFSGGVDAHGTVHRLRKRSRPRANKTKRPPTDTDTATTCSPHGESESLVPLQDTKHTHTHTAPAGTAASG